ncbi:hypothetical protein EON73_02130 [bacterium]|nr:MAG: hypothetical protein EON73_02130 [bacterium]
MLKLELNDRKSHYLTRLGILNEVQALFQNTFNVDDNFGGISFDYGDDEIEHYSFAFHKVPSIPTFWKAGVTDNNIITDVVISSSAMNAIAYMSYKFKFYSKTANIMFLSTGSRLYDSHLDLIKSLKKKRITMIFNDDFFGKVTDIKVAAALLNQPIKFTVEQDNIIVSFKEKDITFDSLNLSLNTFRKAFNVRIPKLRTQKSRGVNYVQDHFENALKVN